LATTNVQTARKRIDATATQQPATEAGRLLEALRDLSPELASRSKEIEDGRRVPNDIAVKLRRLGVHCLNLLRDLPFRSTATVRKYTAVHKPDAAEVIHDSRRCDPSPTSTCTVQSRRPS